MREMVVEPNNRSNSTLLLILMKLWKQILHDIGECIGNWLDYKVYMKIAFSSILDA